MLQMQMPQNILQIFSSQIFTYIDIDILIDGKVSWKDTKQAGRG